MVQQKLLAPEMTFPNDSRGPKCCLQSMKFPNHPHPEFAVEGSMYLANVEIHFTADLFPSVIQRILMLSVLSSKRRRERALRV